MVVYFKSYVVLMCAIAVGLPVVYSTVYPMMTGQLAASSLSGLITMFVLFILGMLLGFGFFERRAQAKADGWVALYNDRCDPQAFVGEGASLASAMSPPYTQASAWYMGYYAQAKLELGDAQDAKDILDAMLSSIDSAKKPIVGIGVLVNAVPLMEKIEGPSKTLSMIQDGLSLCDHVKGAASAQCRDFLQSQLSIVEARSQQDYRKVESLDETVWRSSRYPVRIRAEYAWDGASAAYHLGDLSTEKKALEYASKNGGSLAIASKAAERLSHLG